MKDKKTKALNLIIPLLSIICLIMVWTMASLAIDKPRVLPSFSATVEKFFSLFSYGEFYSAYFGTVLRSLIAFLISFLLALFLVWIFQKHQMIKKFVAPILAIIRVLPTIAVVLLLLVWTNNNTFIAPIIVTILVVLPTTFTSLSSAFDSVDKDAVKACEFFSVSKKDILINVQLQQIAPSLYSVIGAGLSLNLKLMVAAEVLAFTESSIGNYISLANSYDQTVTMMALVLSVVITGLVIELIFSYLSKKAGKWQ